MWRRVLSQSPTTVPTDAAGMQKTQRYLDGWKALGALLHGGRSLSGHERNCCFLNLGQPRFADASSALGFDHDSDSRGLASVDWDGDGDLDLWMVNRTGPRVRFLQNRIQNKHHFLKLKLVGVHSNRDAVGARVEVYLKNSSKILLRSVNAGEGLVSQNSKWLHFGLGREEIIDRAIVQWPGGKREEFRSLVADRSYQVIQETGVATLIDEKRVELSATPKDPHQIPEVHESSPSKRILLPRPIPMPRVDYQRLNGQPATVDEGNGYRLINLWATWCQGCVEELNSWKDRHLEIGDYDFEIIALNVDYVEQDNPFSHIKNIESFWKQQAYPISCGLIDGRSFETFEIVERTLLIQQAPLPIPSSFLIDSKNRLVAVYKGPVALEQIASDVQFLKSRLLDVRDFAVPFSGKWYSDPFPADLMAIPSQMIGLGRGKDAADYLIKYVKSSGRPGADTWSQLGVTSSKMMNVFHGICKLLINDGRIDDAVTVYRRALEFEPNHWETHVLLSSLLIRAGRFKEALAQSTKMSSIKKGHPLPWTNVAWILATSTDAEIRDVKRAIEIAKRICAATNHQEPSALDVLAVAYAAADRKKEAKETAAKAIQAAKKLNRNDLVERIQRRLDSFSDQ